MTGDESVDAVGPERVSGWEYESDPGTRAEKWLHGRYRGMVELSATAPVAEGLQLWVFGCRARPLPGYPETPMLMSLVAVPKNGSEPFHPATDDPWEDMAAFDRDPRPRDSAAQAQRLNVRGCLIALNAEFGDAEASALPWQPHHESPGWWDRMIRQYFPGAGVSECADWDAVIRVVREAGRGARGVVWVRRELAGVEATGQLLYAFHHNSGEVMILDPQAVRSARLESTGVRRLTLALLSPVRARRGSTENTGPQTAEDAIAMTRGHFGWKKPDGSPGPLKAVEFSKGFVVYADIPPHTDLSRPPSNIGYGCVVVDKVDGRLSTWPAFPVSQIEQMYSSYR